jgi:hypothetical protein
MNGWIPTLPKKTKKAKDNAKLLTWRDINAIIWRLWEKIEINPGR